MITIYGGILSIFTFTLLVLIVSSIITYCIFRYYKSEYISIELWNKTIEHNQELKDCLSKANIKIYNLDKTILELTELKEVNINNLNIIKSVTNASVSIDFDIFNVIAIERALDDDNASFRSYTIIGYLSNGHTKEWHIDCSLKTHNILIKEFNAYKLKKNTEKTHNQLSEVEHKLSEDKVDISNTLLNAKILSKFPAPFIDKVYKMY